MDSTPPNFDQLTGFSRRQKTTLVQVPSFGGLYLSATSRAVCVRTASHTHCGNVSFWLGCRPISVGSEIRHLQRPGRRGWSEWAWPGTGAWVMRAVRRPAKPSASSPIWSRWMPFKRWIERSISPQFFPARPQADLLSRLWYAHPPAEKLLKYYDRKVVVTYQEETTITTLDVPRLHGPGCVQYRKHAARAGRAAG